MARDEPCRARRMDPAFSSINPILFWLVAGLTGLCAIATVVTQNIVRAATWLLFTLAGVSAAFFLLGADFVGAVQLLVYVGGTLVLVVFGVMLTAQGPFITMRTSAAEWAVSVAAGLMLLAVLVYGAWTFGGGAGLGPPASLRENAVVFKEAPRRATPESAAKSRSSDRIGRAFLGVPEGPAHAGRGGVVRAHYLLPFELVSVHLLVVLIGAAYLARAKRRRGDAS